MIVNLLIVRFFFFFQAEDGIRDIGVTGVQTCALPIFGPLTIDMYLPALPTITAELGTTSAMVQLTLTGTLVGLAIGQLVLGPLSDTFGRRGPLLAGTALYMVASLLVLVAPTIEVLGVLRLLQGGGDRKS